MNALLLSSLEHCLRLLVPSLFCILPYFTLSFKGGESATCARPGERRWEPIRSSGGTPKTQDCRRHHEGEAEEKRTAIICFAICALLLFVFNASHHVIVTRNKYTFHVVCCASEQLIYMRATMKAGKRCGSRVVYQSASRLASHAAALMT